MRESGWILSVLCSNLEILEGKINANLGDLGMILFLRDTTHHAEPDCRRGTYLSSQGSINRQRSSAHLVACALSFSCCQRNPYKEFFPKQGMVHSALIIPSMVHLTLVTQVAGIYVSCSHLVHRNISVPNEVDHFRKCVTHLDVRWEWVSLIELGMWCQSPPSTVGTLEKDDDLVHIPDYRLRQHLPPPSPRWLRSNHPRPRHTVTITVTITPSLLTFHNSQNAGALRSLA